MRDGVQYGRVESRAVATLQSGPQPRPQVLNRGFKVLTLQLIHCVAAIGPQARKKSLSATLIQNRFAPTRQVILMLRDALPANLLNRLVLLCAV